MKKKKKENLAYKLEDKSSQSLPQSQSPKVIKNLLLYPGYDASSSCSLPFSPLLVQILLVRMLPFVISYQHHLVSARFSFFQPIVLF